MLDKINQLFPIWAIILSILAYFQPALFTDFKSWIIPLLSVIMFGMGLTLKAESFLRVFKQPKAIVLGVTLQFLLMPFYAWLIAHAFSLEALLLAGMVLVGTSPGGTASNVITYLAKGDVALSVSLTTTSTLLAVILTPLLTAFYVGESVPIDRLAMLWSIFKIVLLPVVGGIVLNHLFENTLDKVRQVFPLISMLTIVFIIAIVVALNQSRLAELGLVLAGAVILHNALGLASGYGIARLMKFDSVTAKTLAIEVGMQNSGLAVALAGKYFGAAAAMPGAIFSIWHNISGSVLASWWAKQADKSNNQ